MMKRKIKKKTKAQAHVTISAISVLLVMLFTACSASPSTSSAGDFAAEVPSETAAVESLESVESIESEYVPEESEQENNGLNDVISELKAIENSDTFDVKIKNKEVIKNPSIIQSVGPNDYCVFTIENNTSLSVSKIEIYTVAYSHERTLIQLSRDFLSVNSSAVQMFESNDDFKIDSGNSEQIAAKCDASTIGGVRAIVVSYEDENGLKHENRTAREWLSKALGSNELD